MKNKAYQFNKYYCLSIIFILTSFSLFPSLFILQSSPKYWKDLVEWTRTISLCIVISLSIAGFIPLIIGSILGYFKIPYKLSLLISLLWDIMEMVPLILVGIITSFLGGKCCIFITIIISIFLIPRYARIVEQKVKTINYNAYIEIAKMNGLNNYDIFYLHIWPELKFTFYLNCASCCSSIVIIITTMGFLKLASTKNWGFLLQTPVLQTINFSQMIRLEFLLPFILIMNTVLCFNSLASYLQTKKDIQEI